MAITVGVLLGLWSMGCIQVHQEDYMYNMNWTVQVFQTLDYTKEFVRPVISLGLWRCGH